jgi:hypothetical protein
MYFLKITSLTIGGTGGTYRRLKSHFSTYKKELKLVKKLNMWPETLKLVLKTFVETIQDINIGKDFHNSILRAQVIRARMENIGA